MSFQMPCLAKIEKTTQVKNKIKKKVKQKPSDKKYKLLK